MKYFLIIFFLFMQSNFGLDCRLNAKNLLNISSNCVNSTDIELSTFFEELQNLDEIITLKSQGSILIDKIIMITNDFHWISLQKETLWFKEVGQIMVLNSSSLCLENFKLQKLNNTKYSHMWFVISSALYFSIKVFIILKISQIIIFLIKEFFIRDL